MSANEFGSFAASANHIHHDSRIKFEIVRVGFPTVSGTAVDAFVFPQMETPDQYREYAAECFRPASEAKAEADRKILLELARAWEKIAKEIEVES